MAVRREIRTDKAKNDNAEASINALRTARTDHHDNESSVTGEVTPDAVQAWFAKHVTLYGEPYTLDLDQARAVSDLHFNTLVTARAGSGKTRVIVAKVAFLVGYCRYQLSEIAVFMFNRTAAAEVNQRIAAVQVDGRVLPGTHQTVRVASTFHKYALDLVKLAGEHPQIISEAEQNTIIAQGLDTALGASKRLPPQFNLQVQHNQDQSSILAGHSKPANLKISKKQHQELLNICQSFIARAGQKYPGHAGLTELQTALGDMDKNDKVADGHTASLDPVRIASQVYQFYLQKLQPPLLDFNLLMARATDLLGKAKLSPKLHQLYAPVRALRYLMIDEYQDFSYLFFALTQAVRSLAPQAHLFAVGDDWQSD